MTRIYRFVLMTLGVSLLCSGSAFADKDLGERTATMVVDETQVMLLVGGDWGGGTLLFGDESYSFKTHGLKLGGLGMHKVHMVGDVYRLYKKEDFAGTYFVAEAGITVDKGKGGFWFENHEGVVLHIKASAKGLALNLGVEGLKIKFK